MICRSLCVARYGGRRDIRGAVGQNLKVCAHCHVAYDTPGDRCLCCEGYLRTRPRRPRGRAAREVPRV